MAADKRNVKAAVTAMSEAHALLYKARTTLDDILMHQTELNDEQQGIIASANSSAVDYLRQANRYLSGVDNV